MTKPFVRAADFRTALMCITVERERERDEEEIKHFTLLKLELDYNKSSGPMIKGLLRADASLRAMTD